MAFFPLCMLSLNAPAMIMILDSSAVLTIVVVRVLSMSITCHSCNFEFCFDLRTTLRSCHLMRIPWCFSIVMAWIPGATKGHATCGYNSYMRSGHHDAALVTIFEKEIYISKIIFRRGKTRIIYIAFNEI